MEEQQKRPDSVLSFYKKLIALRKSPVYRETFTYGRFVPAYEEADDIFAYRRVSEENGQEILVAANYGTKPRTLKLDREGARALLSNDGKEKSLQIQIERERAVTLDSCEAAVLLL